MRYETHILDLQYLAFIREIIAECVWAENPLISF